MLVVQEFDIGPVVFLHTNFIWSLLKSNYLFDLVSFFSFLYIFCKFYSWTCIHFIFVLFFPDPTQPSRVSWFLLPHFDEPPLHSHASRLRPTFSPLLPFVCPFTQKQACVFEKVEIWQGLKENVPPNMSDPHPPLTRTHVPSASSQALVLPRSLWPVVPKYCHFVHACWST